ncbi:fibronectin autolysin [Butyrivibrio virus Ceridwen]|nr:fibronectin autolysin [Butyrivibrio virus Ceridwen]
MALTRKALVAMGIEAEKIDQIIEMHTESTDALKKERDDAREDAKKYEADAKKLEGVQKELDDLKANKGEPDKFKTLYDDLKKEYDKYKDDVQAKETKAAKSKAYREMLKEIGVSEKRLDSVIKVADLDSFELDDTGAIKDVDKLKTTAKSEWADFIESKSVQGAKTATPPKNTGASMTKEDIMKIEDDGERQRAIAENHELFGF